MLGLSDAAESIGMRSTGIRTSVDKLTKAAPTPCILHWNSKHFVVLCKVLTRRGKTIYRIADPASQIVDYDVQEFAKCWGSSGNSNGDKLGTVLLLEPSPCFYESPGESRDTTWRGLAYFGRYLLPYKRHFVQLGLALLISSVLQLISPFLTQTMVDVGIGGRHVGFVALILMAQLFLFISQLMVGFIRSWITLHVNANIDIAYQNNLTLP